MTDWISVKDDLPKEDTPFDEWLIALNKDGPFPARYHAGISPYFENLLELDRDGDTEWYWLDGKYRVTHWMPLPDLPVTRTEEEAVQDLVDWYAQGGINISALADPPEVDDVSG